MLGFKKSLTLRENADGVQSIDFDLDVAKRASTAKLSLDTRLLDMTPALCEPAGHLATTPTTWARRTTPRWRRSSRRWTCVSLGIDCLTTEEAPRRACWSTPA